MKNYKRMEKVAEDYGISVAFLKKLIRLGRLTRYKLGTATMIDTDQLNGLIVEDIANHGLEGFRNGTNPQRNSRPS